MLKVLLKTLGYTFFQQHIGMFLVFFYLLFGMIKGYDLVHFHQALLISICSSAVYTGLVFLIWGCYALKALGFVSRRLQNNEYQFLAEIATCSRKEQLYLWIKLYAFILSPILIYAIAMLYVSLHFGYIYSFFCVIAGVLLLLSSLSYYTFFSTTYTFNTSRLGRLKVFKVRNRSFWSWPLHFLINEQRVTLFVCKVLSVVFFKLVLLLFYDVENDIRVYLTGMLAVALSHAVMIFNLVKFDAFRMGFATVLPIGVGKRVFNRVLLLFVILIPEFAMLAYYTDFHVFQLICSAFFVLAGLLAFWTVVEWVAADMDRYLKYLLLFFIAGMLAILMGYHLLFSSIMVFVAALSFSNRYPQSRLKEQA